jgi:DNA primase
MNVRFFSIDSDSRKDNLKSYLDVESLLSELGIENIQESGGEIWGKCPYHNDSGRHWSVNIDSDSDFWGVHSCFVCRETEGRRAGNLVTLVRDIKNIGYDRALSFLESFAGISGNENDLQEAALAKRIKKKRGSRQNSEEEDPALLYSRMKNLKPDSIGWKYLVNRGVTPAQIQSYGVRLGKGRYRNRVVFPIVVGGEVVNFYARAFDDSRNKGLYARKKGTISNSMFGVDRLDKLAKSCYVCEGVFDKLTIERLVGDNNVVATGGSILLSGQVKFLIYFDVLIVVPDMKGKAVSLLPSCLELLNRKTVLLVAPSKGYDIDDYGRKYPDSARQLLLNPCSARQSAVTTVVNYTVNR